MRALIGAVLVAVGVSTVQAADVSTRVKPSGFEKRPRCSTKSIAVPT